MCCGPAREATPHRGIDVASKENLARQDARELNLDLARLQADSPPVQMHVGGYRAMDLGLGHDAAYNLSLRKRLGKPGAPYGGLGFFNPQPEVLEEGGMALTAEVVQSIKLEEFRRCAEGLPSFYYWALQPIFNIHDRVVAAEILVRARNGSNSAPFEDLQELTNPQAPAEVRRVYAQWKAAELVDFSLKALRENPQLQSLGFVSSNLRPQDLDPRAEIFSLVLDKLDELSPEDRNLLLHSVVIEVTEDQEHTPDFVECVAVWQQLGFMFALDDAVGDIASKALIRAGKVEPNFHTTSTLQGVVETFSLAKVDMAWAGHLLFLAHPSVAARQAFRERILEHAREEDELYVANGQELQQLGVKHSDMLCEFAEWSREMILQGKKICIELSVRQEDENCAWAIQKLENLGLEIFGKDSASFCFQGGPCGAKAFAPETLAACAQVVQG